MTVVLFDRELGAFNMNPNLIQSLALRDGAGLEFMSLQECKVLLDASDEFRLQERQRELHVFTIGGGYLCLPLPGWDPAGQVRPCRPFRSVR